VRMAVIAEAFITASSSPVSALESSTAPWCESNPLSGFRGNTHIAFTQSSLMTDVPPDIPLDM